MQIWRAAECGRFRVKSGVCEAGCLVKRPGSILEADCLQTSSRKLSAGIRARATMDCIDWMGGREVPLEGTV